jgi:hypothetical protein
MENLTCERLEEIKKLRRTKSNSVCGLIHGEVVPPADAAEFHFLDQVIP